MGYFAICQFPIKIGCAQFRVVQDELYPSQPVLPKTESKIPR